MIEINLIVARYTFLSVPIIVILGPICLHGNVPERLFNASNGKICLCFGQ